MAKPKLEHVVSLKKIIYTWMKEKNGCGSCPFAARFFTSPLWWSNTFEWGDNGAAL